MLQQIKAYGVLVKFKLNITVVLSAVLSYLTLATTIEPHKVVLLALGGFLVTSAANAINQLIEQDLDALMNRTNQRPLVTGALTEVQAAIVAGISAVLGTVLLFFINFECGFMGALAVFLYTVVYTPLKRTTPFAVFVGAFPGALPTLLGGVAAAGTLQTIAPWILFSIQFIWQFPHFWAIAWKSSDDYERAGFYLLPSGKRDKFTARQILVYSLALIPMVMLPYAFNISGIYSAIFMVLSSIAFAFLAYDFYASLDDKKASVLMFSSFFYLPLIQIAMWLDKI
ncbi:MAG: protoheme IX farnesyltransferase [Bacteroidia bacterium]|nr:protoheme IX farnesyltransferase [Bacteroidia bacterium]